MREWNLLIGGVVWFGPDQADKGGSPCLSLLIQPEDSTRSDLPPFVEIDVFRLDDSGPFGHLPQARAIRIPRIDPAGEPPLVVGINCSNVVPVQAGPDELFQLEIEVNVDSITLQVEKSETTPDWKPVKIKLSPIGEGLDEVTLDRGVYTLFIAHQGGKRCFFRLRY